MKYLVAILLVVTTLYAQPNKYVVVLNDNYKDTFEETIMFQAQVKWGDDLEMVLDEINHQSEAFIKCLLFIEEHHIKNSELKDTLAGRLAEYITLWTYEGWEQDTRHKSSDEYLKHWTAIGKDLPEYFLSFHTDWEMVLDEMERYYQSYKYIKGL